ncbi:hypothetical protein DMB66_55785 [Actinoplanes sp. ATCC 53533]|uniref:hypothetical protein n=1 Tax=Actinoplanes sp. ATCC 53533 TaxID=1288362 RepID=UPI000F775845|nr:hypothetical protein [Actinoplanes sp. ATCC 53533]RSM41560.1 hypothetical protein DMB66_55785 [Actinoplanes sp. ATCC 53533]
MEATDSHAESRRADYGDASADRPAPGRAAADPRPLDHLARAGVPPEVALTSDTRTRPPRLLAVT